MPRKLVFHIGGFKSGSTAVQSTLANKAYSCPSRSLLYPGLSRREGLEKTKGQHGPLADTLFPAKPSAARRQDRFRHITLTIARADADISVVSAEKFEFVDPQLLAEAIRDYFGDFVGSLQIILYLRPHAERLLAEFAERVKHGSFRGSPSVLHAQTRQHSGPRQREFFYHPRVSLWRAAFGDRLTVRPMIPAQLQRSDVVADFFHHILEGADFSVAEAPYKNLSPSLQDLAAIRAFHQACGDRPVTPQQEKAGVLLA